MAIAKIAAVLPILLNFKDANRASVVSWLELNSRFSLFHIVVLFILDGSREEGDREFDFEGRVGVGWSLVALAQQIIEFFEQLSWIAPREKLSELQLILTVRRNGQRGFIPLV